MLLVRAACVAVNWKRMQFRNASHCRREQNTIYRHASFTIVTHSHRVASPLSRAPNMTQKKEKKNYNEIAQNLWKKKKNVDPTYNITALAITIIEIMLVAQTEIRCKRIFSRGARFWY